LLAFWNRKSDAFGDWCSERVYSQPAFGITVTCRNASKVFSPGTALHAWTAIDGCRRFKFSKLLSSSYNIQISADVVRCWLKTIATSGHVVYFTLSWNYPEILDCRQHLLAESVKVSCPRLNRQIWFNQHFQRSASLFCQTTTTLVVFSISILILTWEINFSYSVYNVFIWPHSWLLHSYPHNFKLLFLLTFELVRHRFAVL